MRFKVDSSIRGFGVSGGFLQGFLIHTSYLGTWGGRVFGAINASMGKGPGVACRWILEGR